MASWRVAEYTRLMAIIAGRQYQMSAFHNRSKNVAHISILIVLIIIFDSRNGKRGQNYFLASTENRDKMFFTRK